MVTEYAHIVIDPARAAEFEKAVASMAPVFQAAKGCRGVTLEREVEHPDRYRLIVIWDTIEDHMEGFRTSPSFEKWRATVGSFFAAAPSMIHARRVVSF